MLTGVVYRLFKMSIAGSLFILFVIALRPISTKIYSKKWHYYLWLIAIGILIIPVQFHFFPQPALRNLVPSVNRNILPQETTILEQNNAVTENNDSLMVWEDNNIGETYETTIEEPLVSSRDTAFQQPVAPDKNMQSIASTLLGLLPLIWLGGCIGLAFTKAIRFYRFISYLKQTSWDFYVGNTPHSLLQYFMDFKTCYIQTPFLMGLENPVIYLPDIEWTPEELEMTLIHEVAHSQRKDIHYKLLMQMVLCLHWFNPLVHWMNHDLQQYCELSCDEAVTSKMDQEKRKTYMLAIVKMAEKTQSVPENLTAAMSAPSCKTERRIQEMIKQKRPYKNIFRYSSVIATVVFCFSGVVLASEIGNPQELQEEPAVSSTAWENLPTHSLGYFDPVNISKGNAGYFQNGYNGWSEADLLATLYDEAKLVEYDLSTIQKLELDLDTAAIQVVKGSTPKLKYYQWSDLEYGVTISGNRLKLESNPQNIMMQYYNGYGTTSNGGWIEILVRQQGKALDPEGNIKRVVEITVPDQFILDQLQLSTGTGSIEIDAVVTAEELQVESGTGNIEVNNSTSNIINISSGTGKIGVNNLTAPKVQLDTGTGRINLNNSQQKSLYVSTGTGKIQVQNAAGDTVLLDAGTGSIAIADSSFDEYTVTSGTGSIYVLGGEGKSILANASTGSIRIMQLSGLEHAKLATATGSGHVQLTEPSSGYKVAVSTAQNNFTINGQNYKNQTSPLNPNANKSITFSGSTGTLNIEDNGHYSENLNDVKSDVFSEFSTKINTSHNTMSNNQTFDNYYDGYSSWSSPIYNNTAPGNNNITTTGERMEVTNSYPADSIHSIKIKANATQVFLEKSTTGQFEGSMSAKQHEAISDVVMKMYENDFGVLTIEGRVDYHSGSFITGSVEPKLIIQIPEKLYDSIQWDMNAVSLEPGEFIVQTKEFSLSNNASSLTIPLQAQKNISVTNNAGNIKLLLQQETEKTAISNNAGNVNIVFASEPTNLDFRLISTMGSGKVPFNWKANETSNQMKTSSTTTYKVGNGSKAMEIKNNTGNVSVSVGL